MIARIRSLPLQTRKNLLAILMVAVLLSTLALALDGARMVACGLIPVFALQMCAKEMVIRFSNHPRSAIGLACLQAVVFFGSLAWVVMHP